MEIHANGHLCSNDVAQVIARHDPHHETLRLLELAQVVILQNAEENRDLWHEIRAHLAAQKGTK
jgi:hypothetical protein